MKIKEKKKYVSFGLAVLSFVFLFNPTFSVIDVLPDVFGYLLLLAALRSVSYLNDAVSHARELFMRMMLIDASRILLYVFTFALSSGKSQEMMLLLIYFAAGLLELYTLIPAYKALFTGLTELGYRYDNTSVLSGSQIDGSKNYTEKAQSYTFFFLIFKFVVSILPELSILSTHSYDDSKKASVFYEYIGLLRGFAIILCIVVGAIWLVKIAAYFNRINKDKVFIQSLDKEYREKVLPRESIFIRRSLRGAFVLVSAAAFVCFDVRLDGVNALPDVLAAVLLALGFFTARKYLPSAKKYILCSAVYGFLAFVADFCDVRFLTNHYFGAIIRSEEAYGAYLLMVGSAAIEVIGYIFAVYALVSFMKDVIVNYTGFLPIGNDRHARERVAALHDELKKKLYFVIAAAVLCGAGDIFYPVGARYFGFAGLVSGVCSLLFFAILVYILFDITDEINAKYMLE